MARLVVLLFLVAGAPSVEAEDPDIRVGDFYKDRPYGFMSNEMEVGDLFVEERDFAGVFNGKTSCGMGRCRWEYTGVYKTGIPDPVGLAKCLSQVADGVVSNLPNPFDPDEILRSVQDCVDKNVSP